MPRWESDVIGVRVTSTIAASLILIKFSRKHEDGAHVLKRLYNQFTIPAEQTLRNSQVMSGKLKHFTNSTECWYFAPIKP